MLAVAGGDVDSLRGARSNVVINIGVVTGVSDDISDKVNINVDDAAADAVIVVVCCCCIG